MRNKSIDFLTELLILSAHKFRLGIEAEGSSLFRECINLLEVILNTPTINTDKLNILLPEILAAQERFDWLGLADYLEYELPVQLSHLLEN